MDFNNILDIVSTQIGTLIILSGAVERISQIVKIAINQYTKFKFGPVSKDILIAVVGIVMCLALNIKIDNININNFVNNILTGLIVSFGSNTLHSILSFIQSTKVKNELSNNGINVDFDENIKG